MIFKCLREVNAANAMYLLSWVVGLMFTTLRLQSNKTNMNYLVFFTSLVLVSATHTSNTSRCSQRFHGVRINYLTRRCEQSVSVGCRSPFPYSTTRECWRDFMGQGNICDRSSPCLNGGLCMPVQRLDRHYRRHRHYRCDCMGTRHYGRNCEHRCTRHPPRNEYATACLL